MNYEEKRELRLQISQLLADAGLNQGFIKQMVEEEIKNKIDRAIDQAFASLDASSKSGNFVKDAIYIRTNTYGVELKIKEAIKEELANKVINVSLKDVKVTDE